MRTEHEVVVGDARDMDGLADDSVELVVTSPPYPMIEMWDETFADLDPAIEGALQRGAGREAFELMHAQLDAVWDELQRVLVEGGIACVNVGDATRTLGEFEQYPNHARILRAFRDRGFSMLPDVLWRKPTNSANKFLGSGMVPPSAYVTLEHEYVLVFRNGGPRSFEPHADRRYEAAYFWEERNEWFSDVWTDVTGTRQTLADPDLRERSGAYPLAVPYRLINMYSVYGDTVLDPFWGTGTTTLAAMVGGRNSVGYEIREAFADAFADRVTDARELAREVVCDRLRAHRESVRDREADGDPPDYTADNYGVGVVTAQETDLRLYVIEAVESTPAGYAVEHVPVEDTDACEDVIGGG